MSEMTNSKNVGKYNEIREAHTQLTIAMHAAKKATGRQHTYRRAIQGLESLFDRLVEEDRLRGFSTGMGDG